MSFISIDDRAVRIHERASTAGLFAVTETLFYACSRTSRMGPAGRTDILTKVAYALILLLGSMVLGMMVLTPVSKWNTALPVNLALHPTCSPDHDCWIATTHINELGTSENRVSAAAKRVDALPQHGDRGQDTVVDAGRNSQAAPFGALMPPLTNWSGPALSQTGSASALRSSHQRVSAAAVPSSPKVRLASKQARPPKSRSTI